MFTNNIDIDIENNKIEFYMDNNTNFVEVLLNK